jgi:hypothetical protein
MTHRGVKNSDCSSTGGELITRETGGKSAVLNPHFHFELDLRILG